jgi:ectoine hydroxylase-related dioxygenase (phytanoyl-CoA dioxygenase family)
MSDQSASVRAELAAARLAELAAAKKNLGATAEERSERGSKVKKATSARRLRSRGRDVVFSVRCRPDLIEAIKKHCTANHMTIAEWFESMVEQQLAKEGGGGA